MPVGEGRRMHESDGNPNREPTCEAPGPGRYHRRVMRGYRGMAAGCRVSNRVTVCLQKRVYDVSVNDVEGHAGASAGPPGRPKGGAAELLGTP